jgi:hypothetical protein
MEQRTAKSLLVIGVAAVLLLLVFVFWRGDAPMDTVGPITGSENVENGDVSAERDTKTNQELQTYTHPTHGFTFSYPKGYTIGTFPEEGGEIVLVQGGEATKGFQMFISSYDESAPLSQELIKTAAPDMPMENVEMVKVGIGGFDGITFISESPSAAKTRTKELWFVVDGTLYQSTSYEAFGGEMEKILQSLRFD